MIDHTMKRTTQEIREQLWKDIKQYGREIALLHLLDTEIQLYREIEAEATEVVSKTRRSVMIEKERLAYQTRLDESETAVNGWIDLLIESVKRDGTN